MTFGISVTIRIKAPHNLPADTSAFVEQFTQPQREMCKHPFIPAPSEDGTCFTVDYLMNTWSPDDFDALAEKFPDSHIRVDYADLSFSILACREYENGVLIKHHETKEDLTKEDFIACGLGEQGYLNWRLLYCFDNELEEEVDECKGDPEMAAEVRENIMTHWNTWEGDLSHLPEDDEFMLGLIQRLDDIIAAD